MCHADMGPGEFCGVFFWFLGGFFGAERGEMMHPEKAELKIPARKANHLLRLGPPSDNLPKYVMALMKNACCLNVGLCSNSPRMPLKKKKKNHRLSLRFVRLLKYSLPCLAFSRPHGNRFLIYRPSFLIHFSGVIN